MNQIEVKQCKTCNNTFEIHWKNARKTFCNACLRLRKQKKERERYHERKKTLMSNIKRECKRCGDLFIPIKTKTYACCSTECQRLYQNEVSRKHKRVKSLYLTIQRTNKKIEDQYLKLQSIQNKKINLCVEYESLKKELKK